ncbi:MAG: hypothetical protein HUU46_00910 [Candidatus Hydrogenedentes bacterium]|nr:hypothetical protein [Candidatus Hydrogenedentota bacterium]
MININLLPHHLRPVKRTPVPYIAVGIVAVLAVLYIAFSFISTSARILGQQAQLTSYQQELEEKKKIVEESNELEKLKLQLADKIATIQEIASNRIVWSRELHNLSRLKPENFWYSEIIEDKKSYPMQVPVMDPKTGKQKINEATKKPEFKSESVSKPILRLTGYVVAGADGRSDVSPLTDALSTDAEFIKMFQMEPPSFSDTEFEGFPVKKFTLEFQIQPEGEAAP